MTNERSGSEPSTEFIELEHADRLATTILGFAAGPDAVRSLKPIQWENGADAVYAPYFSGAETYDQWFGSLTLDTIPSGQRAYIGLGTRLVGKEEININSEERINRAIRGMSAGLNNSAD